MSLASLAIRLPLSLWLASLLSSLFIYVKVYCWYPLPKRMNFATFLKRSAVNRVTSLRLVVKKKTLIHCSKTFAHTNIIKTKKFYITFAFWKCVAFLKSLSISLHNPRIIKDAYCLYVSFLHPLFLALKGSPPSYQRQLYQRLLCTLLFFFFFFFDEG